MCVGGVRGCREEERGGRRKSGEVEEGERRGDERGERVRVERRRG